MGIFLTAVLTLMVICGILAALLVLADRKLNNYGTCKLTINGGDREIEVEGGQPLLGALGSERIFIPSACGGRGSCGLCKLKVTRGGGPLLPTEEPHLTREEIAGDIRLSCQLKVREDMHLEIPEALFKVREFRGRVETIEQLTWDIKRVRIALLAPREIDFAAGQYIQLETPAYDKNPAPVYRAYSLASDPADTGHVDMIIRRVPKGICTTWVFEHLAEGDEVKLNGPYGDFRLVAGEREMIFIAGGSGMAPFCSILDDMQRDGNPRKTRYFFGARSKRDLFYEDIMAEYEKNVPDFQFIPALSEPDEDDHWEGATGLITDVVGSHYEDCSQMEAYLCGSPGMIDACIRVLTDRGMPEDHIFYDKFA